MGFCWVITTVRGFHFCTVQYDYVVMYCDECARIVFDTARLNRGECALPHFDYFRECQGWPHNQKPSRIIYAF